MAEELDPFTAEQLLRGEPVDAPLGELLAAAAEPAYADELADEEVVVAAFLSEQARRPSRAFRLKAAIAVLAVAGTGAAAAAATGTLPALRGSQHGPSIESGRSIPTRQISAGTGSQATPSSPVTSGRSFTQPTSPSKPPSTTQSGKPSRPVVNPSSRRPPNTRRPPPTAALVSLCRSYTSLGPRNENPAFTVLVTVAGGKERVRGYCEQLLDQVKTHPQRSPFSRPPVAPRAGRSTSHRSGRPTTHPSNRPATPPAGDPAAAPTPRAR